jgi:hypothetical protein
MGRPGFEFGSQDFDGEFGVGSATTFSDDGAKERPQSVRSAFEVAPYVFRVGSEGTIDPDGEGFVSIELTVFLRTGVLHQG